jgi:protein-glucosylgalactosylhydroxylysine glucosidase
MDDPISPPKVEGSPPAALPALVTNGVVGLRVREIALLPGVAVVSGLSGRHPVTQVEAAAHAPYPLAADIWVNRVRLSDVQHQISDLEQSYDFSCGELHSSFSFAIDGVKGRADIVTLCSRTRPSIVLQEIRVQVDCSCNLTIRAIIDPGEVHGRWLHRFVGTPGERDAVDGSLCWETLGGLTSCGIAYATQLVGSTEPAECHRDEWGEQSPLATAYPIHAKPGTAYVLRQIASLVPSYLHHHPDRQATRIAAFAKSLGFETLRSENRDAWSDLWKGRIHLVGASKQWQALADAAFFYLNSSAHQCSPASTALFGLAEWHNYHYYYGHVMWDLETFALPPLLLLQPHAARSILDYRSDRITAARANARLNGYRGLQFPWESGTTLGEESAPGPGTAAWHEDHISADVALAFVKYANATGDHEFRRLQTWPVLCGVAEWIASRVDRTDHGYTLRGSMGIAERESASDNPAFAVMGIKRVMQEALMASAMMNYSAPPEWAAIEAGLELPTNRKTGAIVSYDGFSGVHEKAATPDPLAGMLLLGHTVDAAVERATLDYFLECSGQYIGSPMLSSLYGVFASWAGKRKLAAKLFDEGYAQFMSGRFMQTLEYRQDKFPEQEPAGPFMANVGGFLIGCLYGLPGLVIGPDGPELWPKRPVVLPEGWEAIEIERIWARGQPARLVARNGDVRARIEISDGTGVSRPKAAKSRAAALERATPKRSRRPRKRS